MTALHSAAVIHGTDLPPAGNYVPDQGLGVAIIWESFSALYSAHELDTCDKLCDKAKHTGYHDTSQKMMKKEDGQGRVREAKVLQGHCWLHLCIMTVTVGERVGISLLLQMHP